MHHNVRPTSERATLGELAYALVDYNMAVRDDLSCQDPRLNRSR